MNTTGFRKTRLCDFYARDGSCRNGSECRFAHGEHELAPVTFRGLAPSPVDVTGGLSNFKTQLCTHYQKDGCCKFGERCMFAHGEGELRPRGMAPSPTAPRTPPTPSPQHSNVHLSSIPIQRRSPAGSSGGAANPAAGSALVPPQFLEGFLSAVERNDTERARTFALGLKLADDNVLNRCLEAAVVRLVSPAMLTIVLDARPELRQSASDWIDHLAGVILEQDGALTGFFVWFMCYFVATLAL